MITTDLINVRRLAIHKQHLAGPRLTPDLKGLKTVLKDIRCLQIDPIRAVERTQHIVLFSRLGPHPKEILSEAAYKERFLFEYWAHAASYVLTEDFPIHNHKMRNTHQRSGVWSKRVREWLKKNEAYQHYILETLKEEGPKMVSEFEDLASKAWHSNGWNSNRNVSTMISALWDRGLIAVSKRDGLKKYWDLAERVHPEWTPRYELNDLQVSYEAAQFAIKALGIGTKKHLKNHFTRDAYPELDTVLGQLLSDGKIFEVDIADKPSSWNHSENWYIHADDIHLLEKLQDDDWRPRTTLLSPFDNLIADRERTELLWDFHYRIEIYVPVKKRIFGYYVLPILYEDRLVGRIDSKMDHKSGIWNIQAVYKEDGAPGKNVDPNKIRGALIDMAAFLDAKELVISGNIPGEWKGIKKL